jgi:hypothetical protein
MRHRLKLYYGNFIHIVLSCIIHYIFILETASTHLSRQDLDSEKKDTQYKVQILAKEKFMESNVISHRT